MEVSGNDELATLIYSSLYYILSSLPLSEHPDFIGLSPGDLAHGLVRISFLNKINKLSNCLFDWQVARVPKGIVLKIITIFITMNILIFRCITVMCSGIKKPGCIRPFNYCTVKSVKPSSKQEPELLTTPNIRRWWEGTMEPCIPGKAHSVVKNI